MLVAGRRFGKTYLALAEMLRVASRSNRVVWYVGPNDRQSKRIVWDRLKVLTRTAWAKRPSETALRVDLISASTITVSGALFIGTPKGRNHFYELFEYAHNDPNWAAFQFTTAQGGVR